MSNQGDLQAAIRSLTGSANDYNGDWHALFDQAGIAVGPFNGRMLAWLSAQLGISFLSLPQAQQAYAASVGATNWSAVRSLRASFTPAQLGSALAAWYSAADLSSVDVIGGQVAQWSDKSGNSNHLVQANASAQPIVKTAGIMADAVSDFLQTSGNFPITGGVARHVFVALTRGGGTVLFWGTQTTGAGFGLDLLTATNDARTFVWGGTNCDFGAFTTGAQFLYSGNDGANSLGGLNGTLTPTSVASVPNTAAAPLTLFARPTGVVSFSSNTIAELFIVSGAIGTAVRQQCEGYIAWNNGLQASLPAGHPYKSARP